MVEKERRTSFSERVLQFQPVEVSIQNDYRAVFEAVDYKPVKKIWELNVKLIENSTSRELGSKTVKWPHSDPPADFRYDSDNKNLVWENAQDIAVLPVRLPNIRKATYVPTFSAQFQPAKPSSQIRYGLKFDDASKPKKPKFGVCKDLIVKVSTANGFNANASSSVVETPETPKANGKARKKSVSQSKENGNGVSTMVSDFIQTLRENLDFNPLFEERLPRDQQVRALKALSYYWEIDGTEDVLRGLIALRFFDLWSVNEFLTEKLTIGAASLNEPLVKVLLEQPSVLLIEDTFVQLTKAAVQDEFARKVLLQKCIPKVNSAKLNAVLDTDDALELLEKLLVDFVYTANVNSKDLGRNLDAILLLVTALSDKFLWINDEEQLEQLRDIQISMNQMFKLCKSSISVVEMNRVVSKLPENVACPSTDFKIVKAKIKKTTVVKFEEEEEEME
ncbi:unnamed protein product [Bursaphelenchus xylophilus]|uniref:(pine wood nematode) hypothetical protein n=1 Tax=Bursaphelenchus xylophilus TaxID=6326 RepID=A0A1I7RKA2_BURXY|nr:unnamed protein product [Bursaphelenchus xylophilus]CAG9131404.1 unnamed protein product [Bursaphelenchus xylophilus]